MKLFSILLFVCCSLVHHHLADAASGVNIFQRRLPTDSALTRHHPLYFSSLLLTSDSDAPLECVGEYEICSSGECVLDLSLCGACASQNASSHPGRWYVCPGVNQCVETAAGYVQCPLAGTHLDWTLDIEQRLDLLVNAATVTEKIQQLTNDAPAIPRLGIPSYNWLNDDEHAEDSPHATVFPNGPTLGATFNKKLLFDVGYAIANEARGGHNGYVHYGDRGHLSNGKGMTMYSPNLNLVRDSRWGRAQEVYSEDPYLTGELTYNFVTGGQGANETETKYLMAAACCKHFAAYDIENIPVSRFQFNAQVDTRNFWENYLPAFQVCVERAQSLSVMCSYNLINGVPTCADPNLLNGILRERWGFDYFVVSDYDAWQQLVSPKNYCPDYTCAAAKGINAGLDQEGGGTIAIDSMQDAMNQGLVNNETLNTAFRRLFKVRMMLGMMDPPTFNPWNFLTNATVQSAAHAGLALQAAEEGIILLQNNNQHLPLSLNNLASPIVMLGAHSVATAILLGNYAQDPVYPGVVSFYAGMFDKLNLAPTTECKLEQDIDYYVYGQTGFETYTAEQCGQICASVSTCQYFTWYFNTCYLKKDASGRVYSPGRVSGSCTSVRSTLQFEFGCYDASCTDTSNFAVAAQVAASAPVVILSLGLDQSIEAEFHDRSSMDLPANQYVLVHQVKQAMQPSAPLICVLVHGGAVSMKNLLTDCDAILDTFYPGSQGGTALMNILFGNTNPAGRLPVTVYTNDTALPSMGTMDFYPNATSGSHGYTYRYHDLEPTFPFGFGLSYTQFQYSDLTFSATQIDACASFQVNVTVENSGPMDGDEVVQLYVSHTSQYPVPQLRLAAFERVHVKVSQTRQVTLTVTPEWHSVIYEQESPDIYTPVRMVEQGSFTVYVGGGQPKYYENHVQGSVYVTNTKNIDTCSSK